jgi:4-hydroxy-2-oxoheptanedioate aldolase
MDLPQNKLKRALRAGQVQIGCWLNLPTHVTVEVMTKAGFDWLLIDTEHSPNDIPQVHQQLQAATGGDSSMVVRVPWNDMVTIKRYLDVGAQSLLIPCVQSEQEAHDAVSYTRYPPKGIRGYASMPRAAHFGLVKDYPKICEDDLFVALQIETQQGMDNIEKIAKIDGVDALFVGIRRPGRPRRLAWTRRQSATSGRAKGDRKLDQAHSRCRQNLRHSRSARTIRPALSRARL